MLAREQIFDGLNDSQKNIVQSIDGKYLVLAGAGSGKTHTLVRRLCNLIDIGVPSYNIVAISFTNKSSNEIKDRVFSLAGQPAVGINMGTFHSLCMRILLPNQDLLYKHGLIGQETITILDGDDSEKILKDYANLYGYTDTGSVKDVVSAINYWSNNDTQPDDVEEAPQGYIDIYREYISYKRQVGYIDFNDILSLTLRLLLADSNILEKYSRRYKYIMVDECQDLNDIQFRLIMLLSSHWENYMMIGDDLQCIYSFRGSNVNNMMNIRDIDPDVQTLLLERNYRSTNTIVNASNDMVRYNRNQLEKISYSEKERGDPIFAYVASDESKEADFITEVILGYIANGTYEYKDFAIIYRSGFMSIQLEMAFAKAGIPYDKTNGTNFYDKAEIKAIASYLRCIQNPYDDVALENIINKPKRGVGGATLDKIKMHATENNTTLLDALKHVSDIPKIRKNTIAEINHLLELLDTWKAYVKEKGDELSIKKLINKIIRDTDFLSQYKEEKSEDEKRIDNLVELSEVAMKFDKEMAKEENDNSKSLTQFVAGTSLFNVDIAEDGEEDEEKDDSRVTLTTVHSAKGLEFTVVFAIGLEEGNFPSSKSVTPEEMEEERRLFYTAMTRAEKTLFLSYNESRVVRHEFVKQRPSRFLSEVPKKYIHILGWDPERHVSKVS